MKRILSGLIVLVIIGAGAWVLWRDHNPQSVAQPAGGPSGAMLTRDSARYANTTYGYAFIYPSKYTVKEYTPEMVSVGVPNSGGGLDSVADVGVYAQTQGSGTFNDFALKQAENMCAADGPTASVRCSGVASSTAFTGSGMQGEEFYLTQVTHYPNGTASTTARGPFFVFDISGSAPTRALIVHVPVAGQDSVNADIVSLIADSISLSKVENY